MITNTTPTHKEAEEGKEAGHSPCFGGEIKKALLPTQGSSEGAQTLPAPLQAPLGPGSVWVAPGAQPICLSHSFTRAFQRGHSI